ncbi:hypothetical protein [Muriicola sp. Z0-33]|uniref:hypothetical protein n=1 Tax=Muriicola sp. Z0-33 TaxID=2816957 RepID=UPI0022370E11|nr:hypothetical protein [Muriicola sp. Z0-33]MCW5517318.1 hypothetical protein [Muriicola sp. Z0-33]
MKKIIFLLALGLISAVSLTSFDAVHNESVYQFKAFNGIRFEYGLLLPKDYDSAKEYEIVAVLCEVHNGDNAWESTMKQLGSIDLNRTILIVPKVPIGEESWGTHPIHHAFNDLLKSVRKSHGQANQKFHLLGFEAGHEVAFWWTYGSSELISSTSIINGHLWKEKRWDKKWYDNLMKSKVPIYAYEDHKPSKFDMSKIHFNTSASLVKVIKEIEVRSKQ